MARVKALKLEKAKELKAFKNAKLMESQKRREIAAKRKAKRADFEADNRAKLLLQNRLKSKVSPDRGNASVVDQKMRKVRVLDSRGRVKMIEVATSGQPLSGQKKSSEGEVLVKKSALKNFRSLPRMGTR